MPDFQVGGRWSWCWGLRRVRYSTRGFGVFAAAMGTALALAACATPSRYMGIELTPGAAGVASELQALAARAQAGDKQAQLELGIRFEEGQGVEPDLARARRLYRLAASDTGGTMWVYSPPVGNGASGRVIPLSRGPAQPGLPAARARLERLVGSDTQEAVLQLHSLGESPTTASAQGAVMPTPSPINTSLIYNDLLNHPEQEMPWPARDVLQYIIDNAGRADRIGPAEVVAHFADRPHALEGEDTASFISRVYDCRVNAGRMPLEFLERLCRGQMTIVTHTFFHEEGEYYGDSPDPVVRARYENNWIQAANFLRSMSNREIVVHDLMTYPIYVTGIPHPHLPLPPMSAALIDFPDKEYFIVVGCRGANRPAPLGGIISGVTVFSRD